MSHSRTSVQSVDWHTVSQTFYDVVIVGAGVAGAIVAKVLSEQGKTVLILGLDLQPSLTIQRPDRAVPPGGAGGGRIRARGSSGCHPWLGFRNRGRSPKHTSFFALLGQQLGPWEVRRGLA